jgi:SAM-dependent methyltransferase
MPETELDFDNDTVSEILVLEHLDTLDQSQRIKALNNWYHVLKPGGRLIIEYLDIEKVLAIFNLSDDRAKLELATILNRNRGGFLLEQLINQLIDSGFSEFKTEKSEWCHAQIFNRIIVTKR